ncbi:hypothetical protein OBBRIDRAFT_122871 [Obba rivulosa]|uniref:Structural maintenance of chromosomes protein 5 n=1 Tax=Obba rivulosa TaxID=1052685 RepID=A0A8E2J4L4_9APHY|nr:hypothetical protein OBBRIDRAFT_122871 [Obba rivulosa]
MQDKNANLERDVKRYEERRAIEQKIALLEMILPFKEYAEAKERYDKAKLIQRDLHKKVKKLQDKNAPLMERKKSLERQMTQKDELREDKKKATRRLFTNMQKKWQDNEKLENDAEDLKNKLDNLKATEKDRQKQIQKLQKSLAAWQDEVDNPPELESMDTINAELRALNAEQRETARRYHDLQEKQRTNIRASSDQKSIIDRETSRLKQLDDVSHRKLEALARWDRDCADVVRWLRDNRHRFKMEIFEPPALSLTVPDKRYATAVENCFSADQMKMFVAQCEEDYALLNRLAVDTPEGLGRKARIHTWYRARTQEQQAPPMNEAELREVGFDGYAMDFVSCPEGLKWFLQIHVRLHRTAIALDASGVNQNRAMEMAANAGGANYVVGNVLNTVTRSRYGKRLPQNHTRDLRPAKNLVHQDIDPTVKNAIDTAISNAHRELNILQEEENALRKEEHEIQAEQNKHKATHGALMDRKKIITDAEKHLASLRHKISSSREKLDKFLNAPSADAERTRIKQQLLTLAQRRANIIKEYARTIRDAIKAQEEASRAALEYCQLAANKTALEVKCSEQEEEYQRVTAEFREADKRYEAAKEDSKTKLQISRDKLASCDEETRKTFGELERSGEAKARSAEEVQQELETQRQLLEMNLHTNAGVVDTYKRRKAEIEKLAHTIEDKEAKAGRIERSIKTARDNWQPALEALVSSIGKRFSAAFDRRWQRDRHDLSDISPRTRLCG